MILDAILISLKVASVATFFSFIFGIILAHSIIKGNWRFKGIIETIILCPMFLPPSVIGYLLLIVVGRNGIIGSALYNTFGIRLVFTWMGAAIAAFIVSLPIMYQSAKATFASLSSDYADSARVMGADEWTIFKNITLPLSIRGIISGLILSFGRAFGEFGATLMVAGNIPGKTQTIPMAIYYAVESGDLKNGNLLVFITISVSFIFIAVSNRLLKKSNIYE